MSHVKITRHLNLNTILIVALGFLSNYYLHDIQHSMEQVRQNTTDIAVIQANVKELRNNCVTEARLSDLLLGKTRAHTQKQVEPQ